MPTPGSDVIFKFGTKAEYEALDPPDQNTLYFLSDTQELYLGDKSYGGGGGEVNWHEIVEGTNIHLFTSITEPEDTLALWIAYDNQDNLRFKAVTDNLPYLDDQGHKNDITDKYNSPTDMNVVEDTKLSGMIGAASFVIDGNTYFLGGISNVGDPDSPELEAFHGIRKFNGTELELVTENISGLTREAIVNAGFACTVYSNEEDFPRRKSVYQVFNYENHLYITETLDDDVNILVYELIYADGEFSAIIKYFGQYLLPVGVDILLSLDFSKIFLVDGSLRRLTQDADGNILEVRLNLADFTISGEQLISAETLSNLGLEPALSTIVGYYEGKYYWFVIDGNSFSTILFKLDSSDNTATSILTIPSTLYYVQPSIIQDGSSITMYGNLTVTVTVTDFVTSYNKVISLNAETDEVEIVDNNVVDSCLSHSEPFMYEDTEYISVGSKITFSVDPGGSNEDLKMVTSDIPAYTLGANPSSILLCIGNRENSFTIYDEDVSEIVYPIDYVLVPNADKSAYIEADAYLYKNDEWVKLGGNA